MPALLPSKVFQPPCLFECSEMADVFHAVSFIVLQVFCHRFLFYRQQKAQCQKARCLHCSEMMRESTDIHTYNERSHTCHVVYSTSALKEDIWRRGGETLPCPHQHAMTQNLHPCNRLQVQAGGKCRREREERE